MGTTENSTGYADKQAADSGASDGRCGKRKVLWTEHPILVLLVTALVVSLLLLCDRDQPFLEEDRDVHAHGDTVMRMKHGIGSFAVLQDEWAVGGSKYSKLLQVLDMKTGKCSEMPVSANGTVGAMAVSPHNGTLAVVVNGASEDNSDNPQACLEIWDIQSRHMQKSIVLTDNLVPKVLFNPVQPHAYCECISRGVRVLGVDVDTGRVEAVFGPSRHGTVELDWRYGSVELLAVAPDGKGIVLGTWARARLWNTQTATEEYSCNLSTEALCTCAAVSPDGRLLATGGDEIELWDFRSGEKIDSVAHGASKGIAMLQFSPDGKLLIGEIDQAGNASCNLFVWRLANHSEEVGVLHLKSRIAGISFLSDGNSMVIGECDGTVSIRQLNALPWGRKAH